jgi:hypothetical protein
VVQAMEEPVTYRAPILKPTPKPRWTARQRLIMLLLVALTVAAIVTAILP